MGSKELLNGKENPFFLFHTFNQLRIQPPPPCFPLKTLVLGCFLKAQREGACLNSCGSAFHKKGATAEKAQLAVVAGPGWYGHISSSWQSIWLLCFGPLEASPSASRDAPDRVHYSSQCSRLRMCGDLASSNLSPILHALHYGTMENRSSSVSQSLKARHVQIFQFFLTGLGYQFLCHSCSPLLNLFHLVSILPKVLCHT